MSVAINAAASGFAAVHEPASRTKPRVCSNKDGAGDSGWLLVRCKSVYRLREGESLCGFRRHLLVNPRVGPLESVAQTRGRFPAKNFLDERVVAVAAVNAFRRFQVVTAFQFHACDVFDKIDKLI